MSPLSEGIDSQGLGGSHGSSSFRFSNNEAKLVSTAIVDEDEELKMILQVCGELRRVSDQGGASGRDFSTFYHTKY